MSLQTLVLQTIVGAVAVVIVGILLLLKRRTLRAQGEKADSQSLAAVENRVRILGVAAIFFALWSYYRFTL